MKNKVFITRYEDAKYKQHLKKEGMNPIDINEKEYIFIESIVNGNIREGKVVGCDRRLVVFDI